ncbi:Uncharacterised protein [Mycobacterium tuberculosis]|nr:Uncharacterised protein [Mycobacterium tuberculosis]
MVANVVEKHPEFAELTDPVTPEIQRWVQTQPST